MDNKLSREEYLFHNTQKLLRSYRDVVWAIEASAASASSKIIDEFEVSLDELLDQTYQAGADLSGTQIEAHMRTISRSRNMLCIIDSAVDTLRRRHKHGEKYYWLLYYSYLSPQEPENTQEVVELISEHTPDISWSTYFRRRREAVECLSSVLWGYDTKNFLKLFQPE